MSGILASLTGKGTKKKDLDRVLSRPWQYCLEQDSEDHQCTGHCKVRYSKEAFRRNPDGIRQDLVNRVIEKERIRRLKEFDEKELSGEETGEQAKTKPKEKTKSDDEEKEKSEELKEEKSICRHCQSDKSPSGVEELISPCLCKGSMEFVHTECLNLWRQKQKDQRREFKKCDVCQYEYRYDFVATYWQNHMKDIMLAIGILVMTELALFYSSSILLIWFLPIPMIPHVGKVLLYTILYCFPPILMMCILFDDHRKSGRYGYGNRRIIYEIWKDLHNHAEKSSLLKKENVIQNNDPFFFTKVVIHGLNQFYLIRAAFLFGIPFVASSFCFFSWIFLTINSYALYSDSFLTKFVTMTFVNWIVFMVVVGMVNVLSIMKSEESNYLNNINKHRYLDPKKNSVLINLKKD